MKIYGPYVCGDGRQRIVLVYPDGYRTSVSYPKWVVEHRLGRRLTTTETVEHINNNPLDNSPSNLRLVSLSENAALDAKRLVGQSFRCPMCGRAFTLVGKRLSYHVRNWRARADMAGPFCSRQCAGLYGSKVRAGEKRLPHNDLMVEYETLKHPKR
jgi:hypothetical protein